MTRHAAAGVGIARVYDDPTDDEGARILVDRLWPRGMHKDDPRVGHWEKDVGPSTELRRWYSHDPDRFAEFADRYRAELGTAECSAALERITAAVRRGPVTLVTASRDLPISQAAVLRDVLRGR